MLLTLLVTTMTIVTFCGKFDKIMDSRLHFPRSFGVFEEKPATKIKRMIFLIIQFYFRDIVVSVFLAQNDFCI